MGKQQKYYVVWAGHRTGVFDNWAECKLQITGYPSAKYKSYLNADEAVEAFREGYTFTPAKKKAKTTATPSNSKNTTIIWDSWSVDAACSGNPGKMEYRAVKTDTEKELFRIGPYYDGTNNVGEFLGLVHCLALMKKKNIKLPLYTDSRTAMSWVRKKKANTTLKKTSRNAEIFDLMSRAEAWLKANTFTTEIIKWDTKGWGEIKADFGRK